LLGLRSISIAHGAPRATRFFNYCHSVPVQRFSVRMRAYRDLLTWHTGEYSSPVIRVSILVLAVLRCMCMPDVQASSHPWRNDQLSVAQLSHLEPPTDLGPVPTANCRQPRRPCRPIARGNPRDALASCRRAARPLFGFPNVSSHPSCNHATTPQTPRLCAHHTCTCLVYCCPSRAVQPAVELRVISRSKQRW